MNDQIERVTIPKSNGCKMTDIACHQATDAESLGKRDNGTVYKAETKIGVAPIDFHRACELIQ